MEKANTNSCSSQPNNIDDINIATFVPFEYATNIIVPSDYGSNSTFALRSLHSCQILEEIEGDTKLGDINESHATYIKKGGKVCHFESIATTMVSCWTIIENDYVTNQDWMDLYEKGGKAKYARTDGIAIVSTVNKVKSFFEKNNNYFFLGRERTFKHDKVEYPPKPKELPTNYDRILDPPFEKKYRYKYQREYRFAFFMDSVYPLEKVTYYVNPEDYIDKIQFGPEMKCQNIKTLMDRAFGPIINLIKNPDFDELQTIIRCPLIKYLKEDKKYQ